MTAKGKPSSAAMVMDKAIDLAIEGRSPYPERAAFIDADTPSAGHDIGRAADEGLSVVLVSANGSTRVLQPDWARTDSPARIGGSQTAMKSRTFGHTRSGEVVTDQLLERVAKKAVAGYDVEETPKRRSPWRTKGSAKHPRQDLQSRDRA